MFYFEFKGRTRADEPTQAASQEELLLVSRTISLFVLVRLSADWIRLPRIREGNLLYSVTDSGINLIKNTLIDTLRNNVCPGILTSHG